MEKNLLETIRENSKNFDNLETFSAETKTKGEWTFTVDSYYVKKYIEEARISELETLIKVVWKKNKPWGGDSGEESDRQIFGYNEAISDIVNLVRETIKKLKEDDEV